MLKIQADGQAIWRAIGDDTSADIVFHRAYIVGGIQKMVQNGYIIRYAVLCCVLAPASLAMAASPGGCCLLAWEVAV